MFNHPNVLKCKKSLFHFFCQDRNFDIQSDKSQIGHMWPIWEKVSPLLKIIANLEESRGKSHTYMRNHFPIYDEKTAPSSYKMKPFPHMRTVTLKFFKHCKREVSDCYIIFKKLQKHCWYPMASCILKAGGQPHENSSSFACGWSQPFCVFWKIHSI
jgi:hypothetical protein